MKTQVTEQHTNVGAVQPLTTFPKDDRMKNGYPTLFVSQGTRTHFTPSQGASMHRFSLLMLLLILGVSAHAGVLVAPNANAGTNGNTAQYGIFGNGYTGDNIIFQFDMAASQLTPMVGTAVTGIGFRLPGGASTITSATTVGPYSITMSGSLNPLGSLSATPSDNIAPGAVTVYNNTLVIPANSLVGGPGPNPFFLINFATPFNYSGGDLLVTLMYTVQAGVDIGVDANFVDSLGDTSACTSVDGCKAEFFNYPITEFQYSATPEPASILLLTTGVGMFLARKRSKR